jgi:hypothetical protein
MVTSGDDGKARDRHLPGRRVGHRSGQGWGLYSVAFVVVNAEQAEDWNGASGREFIEQRERHEQMLGPAEVAAARRRADPGRGEHPGHRVRLW